ncbi:MAG: hypothetical protein MHPSP_004549, partial [Paramarteilia canceri]
MLDFSVALVNKKGDEMEKDPGKTKPLKLYSDDYQTIGDEERTIEDVEEDKPDEDNKLTVEGTPEKVVLEKQPDQISDSDVAITTDEVVKEKQRDKTKHMLLYGINNRYMMVDIIAFSTCYAVLNSSLKFTEEANKQFMYLGLVCISISFAINFTVDIVAISLYKLWPCCKSKKIGEEKGSLKEAGLGDVNRSS